ncbi:MAG: hypothetical protein QW587_11220 [Candidatus Bathyarchaeia archaeon]
MRVLRATVYQHGGLVEAGFEDEAGEELCSWNTPRLGDAEGWELQGVRVDTSREVELPPSLLQPRLVQG